MYIIGVYPSIPNYYSAGACDSSDTSDEEVGPLKKLLRSPIK